MDMNLYVAEWLIRERLAQARAAGARSALVEAAMAERRPVRVRLGTALVSLGRRLQAGRARGAEPLVADGS
jgi:hypothetical protein